jgi:hypothetical protein
MSFKDREKDPEQGIYYRIFGQPPPLFAHWNNRDEKGRQGGAAEPDQTPRSRIFSTPPTQAERLLGHQRHCQKRSGGIGFQKRVYIAGGSL